jgi:hypothetical protein
MKKTKTKEMVETILRNIPDTRNSDITLMIEIWKHYFPQMLVQSQKTGDYAVVLTKLYDLPREDDIKRWRAKFNSQGMYYPTDWEVAKHRGIKEDNWRQDMGYPIKSETQVPTKGDSYMDPERAFIKINNQS